MKKGSENFRFFYLPMAGLPRHWLQDDEMERMRVLLVLALLTILTTQVHAFVIARVGEKSSLSSLFALNDDNDVSLSQSRRRRMSSNPFPHHQLPFHSYLYSHFYHPTRYQQVFSRSTALIRPQLIMKNKKRAQK